MARFMRLTTAGPSYTKPVYSCTKDAPADSFSCTSAGVCMPPTPTIGKAALLCVCKYEMTSVLRFVNGFPLNPPACSVSSVLLFNPSRDRVVLVAITPSIWVSATISIISSNCELLKSGAIFSSMGLREALSLLRFCKTFNWKCGRMGS